MIFITVQLVIWRPKARLCHDLALGLCSPLPLGAVGCLSHRRSLKHEARPRLVVSRRCSVRQCPSTSGDDIDDVDTRPKRGPTAVGRQAVGRCARACLLVDSKRTTACYAWVCGCLPPPLLHRTTNTVRDRNCMSRQRRLVGAADRPSLVGCSKTCECEQSLV